MNISTEDRVAFKILLPSLVIKFLLMLFVILYAGIGLAPDEAQYWTWSQALDWGYYSKPPGIAWQIWLGTELFGNTELGVRFFSLILSFLQAVSVYVLAKECDLKPLTALWCALLMAFCPIGIFGSLLATTDSGLLLFWTMACIVLAAALRKQQASSPLQLGFCILLGALFKWTIYLFWPFFFMLRPFYFRNQSFKLIAFGILLSLFGLLPSLWWNYSHEWATFRHVSSTLQGGSAEPIAKGNFFEFLGSQAALFSPLLFLFLLISYFALFRQRQKISAPLWSCSLLSFLGLSSVAFFSLFQKAQGNWSLLAYPTGVILVGWFLSQEMKKGRVWFKIGLVTSLLLTSAVLSLPFLYSTENLHLSYKINPFKHNMGWQAIEKGLKEMGYNPDQHFLVSDKYQTASILSFYAQDQKRAYFLNLQGVRKNQFCYWPHLQKERLGQTGFFVWIENAPHFQQQKEEKLVFYQKELEKYFHTVEFMGTVPLFRSQHALVKGAAIFKCSNCSGHYPPDSIRY